MKSSGILLVIVLISSVLLCGASADSEENVGENASQSKYNGSHDAVTATETVTFDHVKKDKNSNLDKTDSKEQLESKGGENEQKKANDGSQKDEEKENEVSDTETKNGSNEGRPLLLMREKCDSSSNRCTDDDKTLVACLRVPGNESPELSLLIQNRGKGPLTITISAPDLVLLEKKQVELQENKDTEVKVSISAVEKSHFIILTAGHGNCNLNIKDQFVGRKEVDHSYDSSNSNIFKLNLSTGFLFVAVLLIVVASVFMCAKVGIKYFAKKGPKYQKLDMELPVSHGSKHELGANEGWDDSWDSWDDEEAPKTPSLPLTPSLSSKGVGSRKFAKDGWKD